eukprot:11465928-Alexandrium_andersonii.AAC.1
MIEQPSSLLLPMYAAMESLFEQLVPFRVPVSLGAYGAPSQKTVSLFSSHSDAVALRRPSCPTSRPRDRLVVRDEVTGAVTGRSAQLKQSQ